VFRKKKFTVAAVFRVAHAGRHWKLKIFFCARRRVRRLLELLLGAEVVRVAALLLAAVGCTRRQARVALAADLLLPVELLGERDQGGLHDTTAELEFEHEISERHFGFVFARRFALRHDFVVRLLFDFFPCCHIVWIWRYFLCLFFDPMRSQ